MKRSNLLCRLAAIAMVVAMLCAFLIPANAENAVAADKSGVLQLITCYTLDDGNLLEVATGSCFLIADNAILTAYHVTACDSDEVAIIEALTGEAFKSERLTYRIVVNGDVTRTGTIWEDAYSENYDFAVLKLNDVINDRTTLSLGNSDDRDADTVYALGFPDNALNGEVFTRYTSDDVTMTQGIVGRTGQIDGVDTLQHDAVLSNGSSGGPLVDESGAVIGVNIGQYSGASGTYSYYATTINEIKNVLNQLGVPYTDADEEPAVSEEPVEVSEDVVPTQEVIATEEPAAVDTTALQDAIDKAAAYEEKDYTEDSFAALQTAQTSAQAALISGDQTKIDDATTTLNEAINGLSENSGNKTMIIIIIAVIAVLVIAVVVVVILIVNGNKKKAAAAAKQRAIQQQRAAQQQAAQAQAQQAAAGAAPQAPFATASRAAAPSYGEASGAGETTVLSGASGAGETTVLNAAAATLTAARGGQTTRINRNEFVIGKERAKVDFCLNDNTVSRQHAKIMTRGGRYFIVDLGSTNGTYVNGAKLQPNSEMELQKGDTVKFAETEYTFNA